MKKTMDGNEAAAYASYAFTEVAAIYPITPSSPMAELVDKWSANGKKNIFNQSVKLVEMQSEAGAVAAMHGSLDGGALATSYSASQGLMLMIPTMYRIAGQLKPGVIHVSSRNVATHAISIFAEHSDVMACRQTGFALLASSSVQEAMDLGAVAHLSAIKGHVPFLHFFDGFRTSHEIQKIECLDYDDLTQMVDREELNKFRKNALNPEYPVLRTTGQNPDTYFQGREACNLYYDKLPDIVEDYMKQINKLTGRNYQLFNYYGAPDAEQIVIAMASISGPIQETIDYLSAKGRKVGFIEVHLYRPFSIKHFIKSLPKTVRKMIVLDRTKEPGAMGEPLYEDVCSAVNDLENRLQIIGGRFGLASKDTTPAQIVAIFDNMASQTPKNHFTVGINDDVTHLSIPVGQELDVVPKGTISCKFWGLGSDGTVGANKNTIKIIGDHTDKFVQAYFEYDGKKSGGVTRSHLRFGDQPIRSAYLVKQADFVACHNQSYISKYDMVSELKAGGAFLLACNWKESELDQHLPVNFRRYVAQKNIRLYLIDAVGIAHELGLGNRTNTVLQAAFFKITNIIPVDEAAKYMKAAILKTYSKKGDKIIAMNYAAVDKGLEGLVKVAAPPHWLNLPEETSGKPDENLPTFIKDILMPVNSMKGDEIPVSAFEDLADGTMPQGTSKYEKRGIAVDVPVWNSTKCIQCNQCAYVCPHGAIRPFLLDRVEEQNKPENFETIKATGKGLNDYCFRIQVSVLDCTGCGSCASVCPVKEKALEMKALESQLDQEKNWDYALSLSVKESNMPTASIKASQFEQPLLEFSGACGGCGETPYAKLVTQLFGDRMYIATATGCSQVWATSFPSFPYTTNNEGHGPAVAGSLFENNAEFGLGIMLAVEQQRSRVKMVVEELRDLTGNQGVKTATRTWIESYNDSGLTKEASANLKNILLTYQPRAEEEAAVKYILHNQEHLVKKSIWMFGGDGWAYDIGYGGLDHVLASGANVNVLVFDTEIYSNTGGQSSKATPMGAVAQFAASGKKTKKKDLGIMAMSYGDVYVAQVAMGANQTQLLKTIAEAEAYDGPSLIIAYAPCISHGLKCGMGNVQQEMKKAVEVGYWHLYRHNPLLAAEGKNPFVLDSKEPTGDYKEFLRGEVRYAALERQFPEEADRLFEKSAQDAKIKYQKYASLAKS